MRKDLPRIAYKQNEAAKVLGVSDRTLRDWVASDNPPPHFRKRGVMLFPHQELVEWMKKQVDHLTSRMQNGEEEAQD